MIWSVTEGVFAAFGAAVILAVVGVRTWIFVDDCLFRRRSRRRQWEQS